MGHQSVPIGVSWISHTRVCGLSTDDNRESHVAPTQAVAGLSAGWPATSRMQAAHLHGVANTLDGEQGRSGARFDAVSGQMSEDAAVAASERDGFAECERLARLDVKQATRQST